MHVKPRPWIFSYNESLCHLCIPNDIHIPFRNTQALYIPPRYIPAIAMPFMHTK